MNIMKQSSINKLLYVDKNPSKNRTQRAMTETTNETKIDINIYANGMEREHENTFQSLFTKKVEKKKEKHSIENAFAILYESHSI